MKIRIIGGGPAGSLTAILLKREAQRAGMDLDVGIYEAKPFRRTGAKGCNFCAGVITSRTLARLRDNGIHLPRGVVQRRIDGFFYVTEGGSVDFHRPREGKIYTVFRGGGPRNEDESVENSFDRFLLQTALSYDVEIATRFVNNITRPAGGKIVIHSPSEEEEVDFVIGAFGVNSPLADKLGESIGYYPPEYALVAQSEMPLENEVIDEMFGNRIIAFALKHPRIRFLAVTPKRNYLTMTAVGYNVRSDDICEFIEMDKVQRYLPEKCTPDKRLCRCRPRLPVGIARGAVSERFLAVGDAFASRFYKNGLGSALFSAETAVNAIVQHGNSCKKLRATYRKTVIKRFGTSNRIGRFLFRVNDLIYKSRWLGRIHINYIENERQRIKNRPDRPMNEFMWSLFTGDRSYTRIIRMAFSPLLILHMVFFYCIHSVKRLFTWMFSAIKGRSKKDRK